MIDNTKSGIFLGCGFLLILLGSIPLGQYPLLILWPAEFYHDPSTGAVPYLYLWLSMGVILWLIGTVLTTLGTEKAWLVLMIGVVGIGGGCVISMPWFISSKDPKFVVGILAACASGVIFTAAIRTILNRYRKDKGVGSLCFGPSASA